jgi:outer membrane biosynthesis protein TonB
VLLVLLLASTGLHGGAFALYERLKPPTLPRLTLAFQGRGAGVIESSPVGLSCADSCSARFEPGTRVRLVATVAEGATFEGWTGICVPRADWILECELEITEDTRIEVGFGVVPERIDVAWAELSDETAVEDVKVNLPDPEIEAELLLEPLAQLVEEPPVVPPELQLPKPPPPEQAAQEAPPQPKLEQTPNMISVEVPDENEVEEAPDDATHLSDKNRDVAEETRATDTNLEREQKGDAVASAESDVDSEDIGGQEDEIAQLEDAEPQTLDGEDGVEASESGEDRQVIGMISGEDGIEGEEGQDGDDRPATTPGVLSMRDIHGRGSLVPETEKPGDGGKKGAFGARGKPGIKTDLSFEDYSRIVGDEKLEQEALLGRQKKKSTRMGRYERKLGAVKAALENFTPAVRPGNQTALKTRRAPFAKYIAQMHRSIHELWGFGFLDDLDGKAADHPLNNWRLGTKLEIVLDPDGSIHKITIVEHSGILEFDVAAIDTVLTGEPYGATPTEIRSPDDRAYIHWGFYRDNRQCGTFNANPFILSNPPKESDDTMDDGDLARGVPKRPRAGAGKPDPKARGAAGSGDTAAKNAAVSSALPAPTDAEAEHTANRWISAFSYARLPKLLEITGAPFRTELGVVANAAAEVGPIWGLLLRESKPPVRDWKLMTEAGFRKRFGDLPPGMETGKAHLLMVVVTKSERFTLELSRQTDGRFQVTGLYR